LIDRIGAWFIGCLGFVVLLGGVAAATPTPLALQARLPVSGLSGMRGLGNDQRGVSDDRDDPFTVGKVVRDLGYAAKTTVVDIGYVYSAPARITPRSALWAGGILAVGGLIYAYDQEVYDELKRIEFEGWYRPIREVGEAFEPLGYMGFANKYYIGALVLGYVAGIEPVVHMSADILESYVVAGGLKNAANIAVGRRRPFAQMGPRSFKFNDGTSFPSGHATSIVQLAAVMSHHVDYLPFQAAMYGIAGAVCLQRVTSDNHWASDVYFGAAYGWMISRELLRRNRVRRLRVMPVGFDGGNGVGLGVVVGF
jgi:hypothetical protein